jgi:hypothetical protein
MSRRRGAWLRLGAATLAAIVIAALLPNVAQASTLRKPAYTTPRLLPVLKAPGPPPAPLPNPARLPVNDSGFRVRHPKTAPLPPSSQTLAILRTFRSTQIRAISEARMSTLIVPLNGFTFPAPFPRSETGNSQEPGAYRTPRLDRLPRRTCNENVYVHNDGSLRSHQISGQLLEDRAAGRLPPVQDIIGRCHSSACTSLAQLLGAFGQPAGP